MRHLLIVQLRVYSSFNDSTGCIIVETLGLQKGNSCGLVPPSTQCVLMGNGSSSSQRVVCDFSWTKVAGSRDHFLGKFWWWREVEKVRIDIQAPIGTLSTGTKGWLLAIKHGGKTVVASQHNRCETAKISKASPPHCVLSISMRNAVRFSSCQLISKCDE